jgi:hypothetical protein
LFAFLPEAQNTMKLIEDWASRRLQGVDTRRLAVG